MIAGRSLLQLSLLHRYSAGFGYLYGHDVEKRGYSKLHYGTKYLVNQVSFPYLLL